MLFAVICMDEKNDDKEVSFIVEADSALDALITAKQTGLKTILVHPTEFTKYLKKEK